MKFAVAENTEAWHAAMTAVLLLHRRLGCVGKRNLGIGTWMCNRGTQLHVHFDVVFQTKVKLTAARLAYIYGQKAFYDVAQGESIYVDDDEDTQTVDA